MNTNTPTLPKLVTSNTRETGFYESLLLRSFERMNKGRLLLEMPDGHLLHFGAPKAQELPVSTPEARNLVNVARLRIHSPEFFRRCVLFGDIGFAESYMDGEWDTPDIASVIAWFILNLDDAPTLSGSAARKLGTNCLRFLNRVQHLLRPNSRQLATRNVREHYDLSNEFFKLWLDPSMMYSSALWASESQTLAEAQFEKNEALCRKLRLRAGDHVLEIGSGWGGWSMHAASRYGCKVTTLTLSERQFEEAAKRIREAGLQDRIEVRLQDYRDIPSSEIYDKIVSIEMLEAVGHQYLDTWCQTVARCLKRDGLMALQFITCPDARYTEFRKGIDFIQKHVFPGTLLLSLNRLSDLLTKRGGFVLHALEDRGQDYARTLALWHESFLAKTGEVLALGFDERFLRKWCYYLAYCQAAFALRNISVVQAVYTRPNNLSF